MENFIENSKEDARDPQQQILWTQVEWGMKQLIIKVK